MSKERLAGLENVANDVVIVAHAEFMLEFKDGKSGEWDLDYWIRLWHGYEMR